MLPGCWSKTISRTCSNSVSGIDGACCDGDDGSGADMLVGNLMIFSLSKLYRFESCVYLKVVRCFKSCVGVKLSKNYAGSKKYKLAPVTVNLLWQCAAGLLSSEVASLKPQLKS